MHTTSYTIITKITLLTLIVIGYIGGSQTFACTSNDPDCHDPICSDVYNGNALDPKPPQSTSALCDTFIGDPNQVASTQLYNFELDGDHTYFANGFAVHNKAEVGIKPVDLGSSCVRNSDCSSAVSLSYLACDNATKTCKYIKPYPTFMCQMNSNGDITNWYNYGVCGDWAQPNHVGEGCDTGVFIDSGEGNTYTCQANGSGSTAGTVCSPVKNPIDLDAGYGPNGADFFPGQTQCTTRHPSHCNCFTQPDQSGNGPIGQRC